MAMTASLISAVIYVATLRFIVYITKISKTKGLCNYKISYVLLIIVDCAYKI